MADCIFCRIVKGDLPKYLVYEDDDYLAFLDIFPRTKGHTLLIPKKHHQWVYDVPAFGNYWEKALVVTKAMQRSLKPTFVSFITHGLAVNHAHIHILPRYREKEFVPDIKKFSAKELRETAALIHDAIEKK